MLKTDKAQIFVKNLILTKEQGFGAFTEKSNFLLEIEMKELIILQKTHVVPGKLCSAIMG